MNTPLFSIIIPVYNVEKYLRECLNSVLQQTYTRWELILVDDGSTDASSDICDEYAAKDTRITVIHKLNEGVSVARNVGIEKAKGDYISFIDSDDWVESYYLESVLPYSEFDLVFFPFRKIFSNGFTVTFSLKSLQVYGNKNIWDSISTLKKNGTGINFYGYTVVKVFKRSIVDKYHIRFVEGLRISEDEVFTLDYCMYVNSLIILPLCLYNYRILSTGLTAIYNNSIEHELLANSFLSIMRRENNKEVYDLFIPDVLRNLLMAFSKSKSLSCTSRILRNIKILVKSNRDVPIDSRRLNVLINYPFFIGICIWVYIVVNEYVISKFHQ